MKKQTKKVKRVENLGLTKEELRNSEGIKSDPICIAGIKTQEIDMVNNPPHYKNSILPNGIECCDVIEHFNTNLGTAIKYIWRAGRKGSATEDLEKAKWYLQRQIDLLNGNVKRMK